MNPVEIIPPAAITAAIHALEDLIEQYRHLIPEGQFMAMFEALDQLKDLHHLQIAGKMRTTEEIEESLYREVTILFD
jgi:hypothetical protein